MKIEDAGEVRARISKWIKDNWDRQGALAVMDIAPGVCLTTEWNEEIDGDGRIREYLDIMIVNDEYKLLSEVCPTSYNPQDHDAVADAVIREIISDDFQIEH